MKKSSKILISVSLGVLLVAIIISALYLSGNLQSVLGVSSVNVGADGKIYWVVTGIANNINEGYTFTINKPNAYTKSDGSVVTPKSNINLLISQVQSSCNYQLQAQPTYSACAGLYKLDYYLLGNAQRVAMINIKDVGTGQSINMDATVGSSQSISNSNGGSLMIQTQGVISTKTDCPASSSTVAVYNLNGNLFIGKTSDLDYIKSQLSGLGCFLSYSNLINGLTAKLTLNTNFISSFNSAPTISNQMLSGNINIGSGLFTITADQNYFNSVVTTPSQSAIPKISNINIPSIQSGQTGSMRVDLTNSGVTSNVVITASSNDISIYPTSQNINLGASQSVYFPITAKTSVSDSSGSVNIQVCSNNQFSSNSCDSKSKSFTITGSGSPAPIIKCGDGICQDNENSASCSQDCLKSCNSTQILVNGVCVNNQISCSWYQTQVSSSTNDYGFLGWRYLINSPIVTTTTSCQTSILFYLVILLIAIFIIFCIVLITALLVRRKR